MYQLAKRLADYFHISTEISLAILYDKAKLKNICQELREIIENARFDSDAEEAAGLYRALKEV